MLEVPAAARSKCGGQPCDSCSFDQTRRRTTGESRLIDGGCDVRVAPVTNGWLEIYRPGDLAIGIGRFWKPSAPQIE